jgi:NACalpha-BTF3-like transcription factor
MSQASELLTSGHNQGSKMMDDSTINSGAIAFLMEAVNASFEDATLALENSGGNK